MGATQREANNKCSNKCSRNSSQMSPDSRPLPTPTSSSPPAASSKQQQRQSKQAQAAPQQPASSTTPAFVEPSGLELAARSDEQDQNRPSLAGALNGRRASSQRGFDLSDWPTTGTFEFADETPSFEPLEEQQSGRELVALVRGESRLSRWPAEWSRSSSSWSPATSSGSNSLDCLSASPHSARQPRAQPHDCATFALTLKPQGKSRAREFPERLCVRGLIGSEWV